MEVRGARLVILELVMYAANSGYQLRKPVVVVAVLVLVTGVVIVVREPSVFLGIGFVRMRRTCREMCPLDPGGRA